MNIDQNSKDLDYWLRMAKKFRERRRLIKELADILAEAIIWRVENKKLQKESTEREED